MKPLIVPAAVLRGDRHLDHPPIVVDDDGVRYADGRRQDQLDSDFGVLLERWGGTATGTPQYGVLDPEVQRHAVDRLLCAHCLGQPDREPGTGALWLLRADDFRHAWPADIRTTTPPICRVHAELALERCAVLRAGHLAVRAREAEVVGVVGTLFAEDGHVADTEALVLFTDPAALRFVLGRYLVLELRDAVPDPRFTPSSGQVPDIERSTARASRGSR
ncbi:hypothetical protein ACIRP0_31615 [Streptomyces sp. NPDC101733]|uniref:hypothetical protein n=1 Tax=unclassified Streptomyces TaxID=2593676 RepID=UPI00382587C3